MNNPTFNPFPGLRPFQENESHLFFGREGQSDELLRRLRRTRFLAVVGTSGSGKSSLMRAGLLPALHGGMMAKAGASWHVALMRPGADPLGNLARALHATQLFPAEATLSNYQASMLRASLSRSSLGLIETCKQAPLPANENLLVVVDQFEELFRFKQEAQKSGHGDEAAAFVQLLLEATRQHETPIFVVLTMRSDFLGDCAQFRDLPEAINDGQYLIPRMNREQRRAAITGPITVARGEITDRLVNRLLNDVGDNPDQLPILQHALMRTWDYWQKHRQDGELIDLRHYDDIGGMNAALSLHADEAYNELPDERSRKIAEKVFKRLTEKGADNREVRRPTLLQELVDITEVSLEEVIAVIECFRQNTRSFLMPPVNEILRADLFIDISHESLIRNWKRLKQWVAEEAQSAQIYQRLAETAVLYYGGKAGLWRDPDVELALQWHKTNNPNNPWAQRYHDAFNLAMTFLDESRATRDAENTERLRQIREASKHKKFESKGDILGWVLNAGYAFLRFQYKPNRLKARFPFHSEFSSQFKYELKASEDRIVKDEQKITIALVAKFGTGLYHSKNIARHIAALRPDYTINLGGVYYKGSYAEYKYNVIEPMEPVLKSSQVFTMLNPHDMLSGAFPYFYHIYEKLNTRKDWILQEQEGSYFCLRNRKYQIIGIDTDYHDVGRYRIEELYNWLSECLQEGKTSSPIRTNILLSYQNPLSLGTYHFNELYYDLERLIHDKLIDFWFWNSECYCVLFDKHDKTPFWGSCIGHGGTPVDMKRLENALARHQKLHYSEAPQVLWADLSTRFPPETGLRPDLGNNGFCMLELYEDKIRLVYYDWLKTVQYVREFSS